MTMLHWHAVPTRPYLPMLVKLVLFSSIVHQMAFTGLSSLKFSVGQVQDAGLIFLSAMSTKVVRTRPAALADGCTPLFCLFINLFVCFWLVPSSSAANRS